MVKPEDRFLRYHLRIVERNSKFSDGDLDGFRVCSRRSDADARDAEEDFRRFRDENPRKLPPPPPTAAAAAAAKEGTGEVAKEGTGNAKDIELKFTPLITSSTPLIRKQHPAPSSLFGRGSQEGYALNRTQSTGGIATKVSLELKKKYLLGETQQSGGIQKSGSASTLDSKFKSFHTNISDCQKLLKPSAEISASMQAFCNKLSERTSPLSPTFGLIMNKEKSSPNLHLPDLPEASNKSEVAEIPKCASAGSIPEIIEAKIVNESEGRPRSPVHEMKIIVPVIDWFKMKQKRDFVDSLSSDSDSDEDEEEEDEEVMIKKQVITNIPRLEINGDSGAVIKDNEDGGDMAFDSLNSINYDTNPRNSLSDVHKSITSEKKTLNQPKTLPELGSEFHSALHAKLIDDNRDSSGRSSPTAVLTETELDDFEDVEYELISDIQGLNCSTNEDAEAAVKKPETTGIVECVNILNLNIDNIEFMDTGTEETSSDDNQALKNNGYIQFHNEEDFQDSLSPVLDVVETVNPLIETSQVVEIKENKQDIKLVCDNHDDDSILNVETGTTTEENTCSDSTVKNITEKLINETDEFEEHCQRLQSKIEFSNVKDSLDIKRTRRKSKPDIAKPDLIQEEKEKSITITPTNPEPPAVVAKLTKKEEIEKERSMNQKLVQEMVMNKMRAQNKSLERKRRIRTSFSPIRPFELSKSATIDLSDQNKDLNLTMTPDVLLSTITSPLQKSQSAILTDMETNLPDVSNPFQTPKNPPPSQRAENEEARRTAEKFKQDARARCRLLSDEELGLSPEDKLIKLRQKAAQKKNRDSANIDVHILDSIESLVINTDRRNSLLYSNDTLKRNTSFRRSKSGDASTTNNSELVSKLSIKSATPTRTKSVSEIRFSHTYSTIDLNNDNNNVDICKSDPSLLTQNKKQHQKKPKDRERRKSITKMIAELFTKKKDTTPHTSLTPSKSFLSRISPKSKNKSKEKIEDSAILKRNSISEINLSNRQDSDGNVSPPPIPPLPANYVRRYSLRDESSDAENEFRHEVGSCEALDHSEANLGSLSNCPSKKLSRSSRRTARQAQLKRHRTAQEIQRKLEETEVKARDLEFRGVQVEKALRGEANGSFVDETKEESDLLKEWFDLMRDRTELRRYEKELMVRAQELELEDRHARLQHELRERLDNNEPKSKEEMEVEGDIIKEMMEIVAKRDSLITLLEEDRLRYFEEDKDFEEQILAKGIQLTPLVKTTVSEK
ncbi:Bivalent Mical/EHBP Rab binding domain [Popillia japonica]|uniref:Bivalent Mical/EHBP Rab binding domain n=1 Tax=Popillia japonica TaxID=7064 RepID=A0AAW1MJM4_POPJA